LERDLATAKEEDKKLKDSFEAAYMEKAKLGQSLLAREKKLSELTLVHEIAVKSLEESTTKWKIDRESFEAKVFFLCVHFYINRVSRLN
jgi:hypothetical protein